jgi:hypothetical protein
VAAVSDMAALSGFLPGDESPAPRRLRLLRLRQRRVTGLERIPERYRLQFLLLASERLPGAPPAQAVALAGRVADRVRVPPGLVAESAADTSRLDAWFRAQAPRIAALMETV